MYCPISDAPVKEMNIASTISKSGGVHPKFTSGIFLFLENLGFQGELQGHFQTTPFMDIRV
jgi:hypothetical protein